MATRRVQRARREEDKDERRRALLDATQALFEERSYAEVKVADVAARAGFAKGTVFAYYATKESLFLALTERLLGQWIDALDRALRARRGETKADRIASLLASSLAAQPTLTRLLAMLGVVLEQEADDARILAWKTRLVEGLGEAGALLERKLPWLGPGGGAALLLRTYVLVVGLHALCEPSPRARQVIDGTTGLELLRFDFAKELEAALTVHLRGLEALASD